MRLDSFAIVTGVVSNKVIQGQSAGHSGTVTLTAPDLSGFMSVAGGTMILNDGSSTRTITFGYGSSDADFNVSGIGSNADFRSRMVTAVNGSSGGSVAITAANPGSGNTVTLTHDSSGVISISFGGDSTSASSLVEGGVTALTVSPSAASQQAIQGVSEPVVTGSFAHGGGVKNPIFGKITLRDGANNPASYGAFNVMINKDDIVDRSGNFDITGSLSAHVDIQDEQAKKAEGDVLIISNAV